jgi:hypothetical protein
MRILPPAPVGLALALLMPATGLAQVPVSGDAVEEIQSLSTRADVIGGADGGRLARLLDDVLRQELNRADLLFERGDPRSGDCCVLRLDVRLATGSGRARFGTAFVARLELGYEDRLGNLPTWTVIWTGRVLSNIVERAEMTESLRFAARELIGDFIDLYREHFPRREQ